jgi:phosphinothricin acetyltransferase
VVPPAAPRFGTSEDVVLPRFQVSQNAAVALSARPAAERDDAAIARIYSEGIADRVATFETEPRSAADIRKLLSTRLPAHPALVVESGGEVVAFAWSGPYSERPCYAGVGEFSVYVARGARRTGAGTVALGALLDACEEGGFWKLVSKVFPENTASRRLCARHGFTEVGLHRNHARLDGEWRDVVVVERLLGEAAREAALGRPPGNPTPPPGRAEPYRSSKGLSMT